MTGSRSSGSSTMLEHVHWKQQLGGSNWREDLPSLETLQAFFDTRCGESLALKDGLTAKEIDPKALGSASPAVPRPPRTTDPRPRTIQADAPSYGSRITPSLTHVTKKLAPLNPLPTLETMRVLSRPVTEGILAALVVAHPASSGRYGCLKWHRQQHTSVTHIPISLTATWRSWPPQEPDATTPGIPPDDPIDVSGLTRCFAGTGR
jgi:hypothetical protein